MGEQESRRCAVCGDRLNNISPVKKQLGPDWDYHEYECQRCNRYELTRSAEVELTAALKDEPNKRFALSHWVAQSQRESGPPHLNSQNWRRVWEEVYLPGIAEQADNLIYLVGQRQEGASEPVYVGGRRDQAWIGVRTLKDVAVLIMELSDEGLVWRSSTKDPQANNEECRLTLKGYRRYEEIRHGRTGGEYAFLATPFNQPELDEFVKNHLRAAVESTGYKLRRVDTKPRDVGLIDLAMRQQIRRARFVIAELANDNLGVYWESGYAEGIGKPVFNIAKKGTKPHFDKAHEQIFFWDPEDPTPEIEQLKAAIRLKIPEAIQADHRNPKIEP